MTKLQRLHMLLQDNNLNLSLADLIQYTYNQWCDQYLTTAKAAEHLAAYSFELSEADVELTLQRLLELGKIIEGARV